MLNHLLQLVEDVGFEEVLAPSLSIDVVLEGLQPSITNCFGLAASATVDLMKNGAVMSWMLLLLVRTFPSFDLLALTLIAADRCPFPRLISSRSRSSGVVPSR